MAAGKLWVRRQIVPESDEELLRSLLSLDRSISLAAEDALRSREANAVPVLLEVLKRGDRIQRYTASRMFGLDPASAVQGLRILLGHQGAGVRYWALESLKRLGTAALPALEEVVACVRNDSPGIRARSVHVLGNLHPLPTRAYSDLIFALINPARSSLPLRQDLVGILVEALRDHDVNLSECVEGMPASWRDDAVSTVLELRSIAETVPLGVGLSEAPAWHRLTKRRSRRQPG